LLDRWAYKFVHALLQKLLKKGNLNLQANTPVLSVSDKHSDGWIRVTTPRGEVRARTVIHTTNRWASHLRPEFEKLILPERGTVAAIKAPAGFLKRTGAQHWDSSINVSRSVVLSLSGLTC
jgi:glycine/D-amino acid oxidase-like deaminating enzyme